MPQKNIKTFIQPKGSKNMPGAKFLLLILVLAGITITSFSCKKAIEQQQKNIIINAMTNGRWYVQQYKENTVDITDSFSVYEFQFYENGSVDGINSTITKRGTWSADVTNYTITAAFPPAAGDTLTRLNYTWKITDSYLDYVEAKTTTSTGENILHLRKK